MNSDAPEAGTVTEALGVIAGTALDVLPIALFVLLFQYAVIRRPLRRPGRILAGFGCVVFGLGLFLVGLEQALFPLGRLMAAQLTDPEFLGLTHLAQAHWLDYYWVYLFALALGFSATIAEPALLAVALKANQLSAGAIGVTGLRVAVAIGASFGVALGCVRIVTGVPLHFIVVAAYLVVALQTMATPRVIVPLAYDSGGVTTSTVTVPLVTALGLGLAETVPGRSVLLDGFGMVALTCLFPIMAVLGYAQLSDFRYRRQRRGEAAAKDAAQQRER